jgi:hypothetical protein
VKSTIKFSGLRNRLGLLTLTFLVGSVAVFGQGTPAPAAPDTLSGKYEGTVKTAGAPDEKISLELKNEAGKISGRLMHGTVGTDVTEGTLKDGTLSLTFGKEGSLTAKVEGDKLVGNWTAGAKKGTLELTKVTPAAASAAPAAAPATGPVNLTGEWDAVADANGQPFPFALTLKIDGENVTGSSSSQLGESTVKSGTWKDGKLAFQLEGQNGVISMSATVIEGKLSGEFDYAGQLQGKWVAVKKN